MRVVASAKRADDERVFVPVTNNDGWKSVRTWVENQMIVFCFKIPLNIPQICLVFCFKTRPCLVHFLFCVGGSGHGRVSLGKEQVDTRQSTLITFHPQIIFVD